MPEIIVHCPQCERPLRVPEHLIGRPVQCPACGLTLSVPPGSQQAQPLAPSTAVPATSPPIQPSAEPVGQAEEDFRADQAQVIDAGDFEFDVRRRARSLVLPPAICLLVCSVLGILGDVFVILYWSTAPDQAIQHAKAMGFGPPPPPEFIVRIHVGFAVLSLVNALAAIQMMRLRMYPFALAGCILSMLNCGSNCCLIGIPLGFWALVVLLKPEVRSAFQ
jgi:hypothetical protein